MKLASNLEATGTKWEEAVLLPVGILGHLGLHTAPLAEGLKSHHSRGRAACWLRHCVPCSGQREQLSGRFNSAVPSPTLSISCAAVSVEDVARVAVNCSLDQLKSANPTLNAFSSPQQLQHQSWKADDVAAVEEPC